MMRRGLLLFLACAGVALGEYQYYYTDDFTDGIDAPSWNQNGGLTTGSNGLTSSDPNGGSLISAVAVPDGTHEYEVKAKLKITQSGGRYVFYFQATPDAKTGPQSSGTFFSVEIEPTVNGGGCSADLRYYKRVTGVVTYLGSAQFGCWDGMEVRAVWRQEHIEVFEGTHYLSGITYLNPSSWGQPGIGILDAPTGNGILDVSLGLKDRVAPSPVDVSTVASAVFPDKVELRWRAVADDANGSGLAHYRILRDGQWLTAVPQAGLTDTTVQPSTTYEYMFVPVDCHGNYATSTVTVTTPPVGHIDPRRVGVHPRPDYWGAMGEQIDMRSGNLNFSLPLLAARGRNGVRAPVGLTVPVR